MAVSARKIAIDGFLANNPVLRQVLGICSTLAVTNLVVNTAVMCIGLIYAQVLSCVTASLLRSVTPHRLRILSSTLIIAAYVICLHTALLAYLPDISSQLGPYVGLIITNCVVLGRVEAFAMQNRPWPTFVDALFSGLGYSWVLLLIACARETLGFGTLAGFPLPFEFTRWSVMVVAPGAFFMLALVVWGARSIESATAAKIQAGKG